MRGAVFLDRDGVVIEDVHLLTSPDDLRILKGVPQALSSLRGGGFELVIITNQAVIARGQATEQEVRDVQARLEELLLRACVTEMQGRKATVTCTVEAGGRVTAEGTVLAVRIADDKSVGVAAARA